MRVLVPIVMLFGIGFGAKAQETKPAREVVMYDPLFWREELSLKNAQSKKIEQINTEFYNSLRQLKAATHSKSELRSQLNVGLQERSVKIWATLDSKQRRKLERILEQTSPHGS